MKAVQRRAEDNLVPARNGFRHPSFRQETQQMLVLESAKPPFWVQLRQEIEDVFIEKRITHLDRRMHRDAIAFRLEEMTGQENARRDPDSAMERRPALC